MSTVGQQNPAAQGITRSSSATALDQRLIPSSNAAVSRPRSLSPLPPNGASTAVSFHGATSVVNQPNTLSSRARSLSPLPPNGASTAVLLHQAPSSGVVLHQAPFGAALDQPALPGLSSSLPLPPTAASMETSASTAAASSMISNSAGATDTTNGTADQSLLNVTPTTATANILSTLNHTSSQTYSMTDNLQQDDNDLSLGMDEEPNEEHSPAASGNGAPSDWANISPNQVMARLKLLKAEVLDQHDLRPFYKSYSNWEKMSTEQRNKAVAWFRKLPESLKGNIFSFFHS